MKLGELQSFVSSRFDVDPPSLDKLVESHEAYFGDISFFDNAKRYLKARFDFLVTELARGRNVFCPDLFHALLGCLITNQPCERTQADVIAKHVLGLRCQGGFLTAPRTYVDQFPKFRSARTNPSIPEVYSSYYSYYLLQMLNVPFSGQDMENLVSWMVAHQKKSGAIYSDVYSDTPEPRRFETEVACQTFFGINVILSAKAKLPEFDPNDCLLKTKEWALGKWLSLRTVAGRYFALKTIQLVCPEEVSQLGSAEAIGFLEDRSDHHGEGYYDYRLSDKIDEFMSSSSATQLDKISPHVFSTYYAASIMKILWSYGASIKIPLDRLKRLATKAANQDSGFGIKVMVKDFPEPYGPVSTELETLLILLLPLLTQVDI